MHVNIIKFRVALKLELESNLYMSIIMKQLSQLEDLQPSVIFEKMICEMPYIPHFFVLSSFCRQFFDDN